MKKPIKTIINDKENLIVCIQYHDGKPHDVITLEDGDYLRHWDFDMNMNWGEFMYYNSRSGGDIKKLCGPQYADGVKGTSIWYADCVKFRRKYPPRNCRILKHPIRLKNERVSTLDPFKYAYQEVNDIIYCKECDGYYHEDGCSEHMNMWDYKYNDGTEIE